LVAHFAEVGLTRLLLLAHRQHQDGYFDVPSFFSWKS
jgi:hypothetical protein